MNRLTTLSLSLSLDPVGCCQFPLNCGRAATAPAVGRIEEHFRRYDRSASADDPTPSIRQVIDAELPVLSSLLTTPPPPPPYHWEMFYRLLLSAPNKIVLRKRLETAHQRPLPRRKITEKCKS